jgi:hypothetical protein
MAPGTRRDRIAHRCRLTGVHDHCRHRDNFLGTLIRHFLARAIPGLARGVIASTLAGLLVALVCSPARHPSLRPAARLRAIPLPSIAVAAQVEHQAASATDDLAEAVVVRVSTRRS